MSNLYDVIQDKVKNKEYSQEYKKIFIILIALINEIVFGCKLDNEFYREKEYKRLLLE